MNDGTTNMEEVMANLDPLSILENCLTQKMSGIKLGDTTVR
jgi:hypothetical protein